jgi:hypothetical protein
LLLRLATCAEALDHLGRGALLRGSLGGAGSALALAVGGSLLGLSDGCLGALGFGCDLGALLLHEFGDVGRLEQARYCGDLRRVGPG